ncbi:MAG: OmpH family outer membrane protein [Paracoccus sp. (in: a-proteobacteria)]
MSRRGARIGLCAALTLGCLAGAALAQVSPVPATSFDGVDLLRVQAAGTAGTTAPVRRPVPLVDQGVTPAVDLGAADDISYGVLVLNVEAAYAASAWGKRAQSEIDAEVRRLDAENKRLEEQLKAEEQALSAERASLGPKEFRARAEAFDSRAQTVRRERAQVVVDLETRAQADLDAFLEATRPLVSALMQERHAGVVLDRRQALVVVTAVDITDELVKRMDQMVGAGMGLPPLPSSDASSSTSDQP